MSRFKLKLSLTGVGLSVALAPQGSGWAQEIAYEVRGCGVNEASVIDKAGDMTIATSVTRGNSDFLPLHVCRSGR